MTPQTFSLEMCRLLSSFAPEFEGHWYWYSEYTLKGKKKIPRGEPWAMCIEAEAGGDSIGEFTGMRICPAWQVEDLLRNWSKIVAAVKKNPLPEDHINKYGRGTDVIVLTLIQEGDTAYQKIEEYLWSILK